jgi:hypothetical protein
MGQAHPRRRKPFEVNALRSRRWRGIEIARLVKNNRGRVATPNGRMSDDLLKDPEVAVIIGEEKLL